MFIFAIIIQYRLRFWERGYGGNCLRGKKRDANTGLNYEFLKSHTYICKYYTPVYRLYIYYILDIYMRNSWLCHYSLSSAFCLCPKTILLCDIHLWNKYMHTNICGHTYTQWSGVWIFLLWLPVGTFPIFFPTHLLTIEETHSKTWIPALHFFRVKVLWGQLKWSKLLLLDSSNSRGWQGSI